MRPLNDLFRSLSALALTLSCACSDVQPDDQSDPELELELGEEDAVISEVAQEARATSNGLRTINGLRSINGLRTLNGLNTRNGLRTINGLTTVNGLRTFNGLRTYNGMEVDCTGKTLNVNCTGQPDGLLSMKTGLMASAEGVTTARYLVRCALPAGDSIKIKDYASTLQTLGGEMGLAPQWKDGQCDGACEEKISACLMALTNGSGANIAVELAANYSLGSEHRYPYQEAAFYGNLFVDPPKMFYCIGDDFYYFGRQLETRACAGYNERYGYCPYMKTGTCGSEFTSESEKRCDFSFRSDTASACKEKSAWFGSTKSWRYPITTFRSSRD